ncbi:MAG: hypothetical protein AABX34_01735 [Nanoarchaeota archaeon]
MATIKVNVSDEINKEFKKAVEKKLGHGKGLFGKALEEAIKKWTQEEKQKEIAKRAIDNMHKGLYRLKG